jgi:hypothetical protein
VEDTASAGGSTAVSATDSAVRGDSKVEGFLTEENMGASLIAAFVIVVFATLMGASSALDILTFYYPYSFYRGYFGY